MDIPPNCPLPTSTHGRRSGRYRWHWVQPRNKQFIPEYLTFFCLQFYVLARWPWGMSKLSLRRSRCSIRSVRNNTGSPQHNEFYMSNTDKDHLSAIFFVCLSLSLSLSVSLSFALSLSMCVCVCVCVCVCGWGRGYVCVSLSLRPNYPPTRICDPDDTLPPARKVARASTTP